MSNKIVFTKTFESVSDAYAPRPSSEFLPDWYKKTSSYVDDKKDVTYNGKGGQNATIKKCMPVFDALTAGYTIPTYTDLYVKKGIGGDVVYHTSHELNIEGHGIIQAPFHPFMNQQPYPKWINPWGIKTPPGYSCLFLPPVHGGNSFFRVIEGFVDTDTYDPPINFPFVLNDINFEGLIPAGTPMVQVIPVKRDSWKSELSTDMDSINEKNKILFSRFFDVYKTTFWHKKEYK